MTNEKVDAKRLRAMALAMAAAVETASDRELLDDAKTAGRSSAETLRSVKAVLSGALVQAKRQTLEDAKAEYADSVAKLRVASRRVPKAYHEQVALLTRVLSTHPEMRSVTLQHREYSELTEEDVLSLLKQLDLLGMLSGGEEPPDEP